MATITARFDSDGEAAIGCAGTHTLIADRPKDVAGGRGLGLNGGQLLALALGGCLCNDLRYVAHARKRPLGDFGIDVDVDVQDGRVTAVDIRVEGGDDVRALLGEAVAGSTIVAAVRDGAPITVR